MGGAVSRTGRSGRLAMGRRPRPPTDAGVVPRVSTTARAGPHRTTLPAALDPSSELQRLMVSWRMRLDRTTIPELTNRSTRPVTQEEMAELCEVSPPWYGSLERGVLDKCYSDGFLDRVATALELTTVERQVLYRLAAGREPTSRKFAPPQISPAIQAHMDSQRWPAYLVDAAWNILTANAATWQWMPQLASMPNTMRWAFCSPAAIEQLVDWEHQTRMLLAQLRAQHASMPDHCGLKDLITEILQTSELARDFWENQPEVWMHEDGDHRMMRLPGNEDTTIVEILSWTPLRNPDLRAFVLVPVSGYVPDDCQEACPTGLSWEQAADLPALHGRP